MLPIITLTTTKIICKSSAARNTVLRALQKTAQYSLANEPDVLQYLITIPISSSSSSSPSTTADNINTANNNTIYTLSHHTTPTSRTTHLKTPPSQHQHLTSLLSQLSPNAEGENPFLARAPSIHTHELIAQYTDPHPHRVPIPLLSLSSPPTPPSNPPKYPTIILSSFDPNPLILCHALKEWDDVVIPYIEKREDAGLVSLAVMLPATPEPGLTTPFIRTVEIYDSSWPDGPKVNKGSGCVKGPSIREVLGDGDGDDDGDEGKDRRGVQGAGVGTVRLRVVGGFFERGSGGRISAKF